MINSYYNPYNQFKYVPPHLNHNYYNYNNYYKYTENSNENKNNKNENIIEMNNFKKDFYNTQKNHKKWFKISNGKIKIFDFNIESEDILLIGLIIFLLLQKEKDYILIIILGLMILNLSITDFKDLKIFKDLYNLF